MSKRLQPQPVSGDSQKGYVVLMAVILITTISLLIAVSLLTFGSVSSKSSTTLEQSAQSRGLADACMETALRQLRVNFNFSGTGNLTLTSGTCQYNVIRQGSNRIVQASGTVGTLTRKAVSNISRSGSRLVVNSWQEVGDF